MYDSIECADCGERDWRVFHIDYLHNELIIVCVACLYVMFFPLKQAEVERVAHMLNKREE